MGDDDQQGGHAAQLVREDQPAGGLNDPTRRCVARTARSAGKTRRTHTAATAAGAA